MNDSSQTIKKEIRILGQLLAAQNILFVLPTTKHIVEFYAKSISSLPGIYSCSICLEEYSSHIGKAENEVCIECEKKRKMLGSDYVISNGFTCNLADLPDVFIINVETTEFQFGFFIFHIENPDLFEPYKPFVNNLGNFVALSLENRIHKNNLLSVNNLLEQKVEKRTEEIKSVNNNLKYINRKLQAISDCNQTLMRASDDKSLLSDVCNIVCEKAGYRMCWVGYAENDINKTIKPVAWAGFEDGYLRETEFTWADTENGCRPAGRAIREGKTIFVQDFSTDIDSRPWLDSILKRNFNSGFAIPLKDENLKVFGILVIYSSEKNTITSEEIKLMEELAGNLAFGITTINTKIEKQHSQEAFFEQYSILHSTINSTDALIFSLDSNYCYTSFNKEHSDMMKKMYDANIKMGNCIFDYMTIKEDREIAKLNLDKAMSGENIIEESYSGEEKRTRRYFRVSHSPIKSEKGSVKGVVVIAQDITELKKIEEEKIVNLYFFESLDKINLAIQGTNDLNKLMENVLDSVLEIFNCDRAWLAYPGEPDAKFWSTTMERTKPEYPGAFLLNAKIPMDDGVSNLLKILKSSDTPIGFGEGNRFSLPEEQMKKFNLQSQIAMIIFPKIGGSYVFGLHQCSHSRIWNSEEIKLFKEIGSRVSDALTSLLSYRNIKISEEKFRTLFEESFDGLFITSPEGKIVDMNKKGISIFGYESKDEILKLDLEKDVYAYPPDRKRILEMVNSRGSAEYEVVVKKKNGEHMNTYCSLTSVKDNKGKILMYRGIIRDISDIKLSEKNIALLNFALNNVHESAFLTDENSCFINVNECASRTLGYSKNELLEMNVINIDPDFSHERWLKHWEELKSKKSLIFEGRHITKKGRILPVEISANYFEYDGKGFNLALVRDITERKKTEEKIQNLSRALEQSPSTVVITDLNGNIEYVNPKFFETTGYTMEEVLGKNPRILKSGEKEKEEYAKLWKTISSGEEWRGEFHNKKKNGELYWESASISPIRNTKGDITHYLAVKEDITEKKIKEMELVEAKEKAVEMNRLKSSFLANMSHELRTPMVAILGFAEALTEILKNSDEKKMAEMILKGGKRLTNTLNLILDLSRVESSKIEFKLKPENISFLVSAAVNLYKPEAEKKNLKLLMELENNVIAEIDFEMMEKVLDNLIQNAIKYTDTGEIKITTGYESIQNNKFAFVKVSDTGIGIPVEMINAIFEPFRQVSEGYSRNYEGTGLGLSITKKYVELMNGTTLVESKIGIGSSFTVRFPYYPENNYSEKNVEIKLNNNLTQDKSKTKLTNILIVDDDELSVSMIEHILKDKYNCEIASSGEEALKLASKNLYSIILLDIGLKGMNGINTMKKIRKLDKYEKIPIIAVTAFAMKGDKEKFLEYGYSDYISKPFYSKQLLEVIERNK